MIREMYGSVIKCGSVYALFKAGHIVYRVFMPQEDLKAMDGGDQESIFIYHHQTESGQSLFGFVDEDRRNLFELLIKARGIGGKGAIAVLNLGPTDAIKQAIKMGQRSYLEKAKGVGQKAANEIIISLAKRV